MRNDHFKICFLGDDSFKIYDAFEVESNGCETDLYWEINFSNDYKLKQMGKVISCDFDNTNFSICTGTKYGWICVYDLGLREQVECFRVKNPDKSSRVIE